MSECKRPGSIAVVGMALRVPGATTPEQFWRNVVGKVDSLTRTSVDALRAAGVAEALLTDPRFVPVKPLLSDVEYFDAALFDMTPFEAERTDPAHRLFLECAVEALERAGIAPGPGAPVTGVFGGSGGQSYFDRNLSLRGDDLDDPIVGLPLRLGNSLDFLPARVSFKLGLVGPSFAVQAACATSLIAVHLAVESLRRGECQVALAGGAAVEVPQVAGYLSGVDGMLSDSGWLRPFDAGADGTVFGSGIGVVVLRPLEDALAQGNPIHAVILGSATTNDGAPADKASFVAPSVAGQRAAVARALAEAGVDPETIGYVEAHGTGTRLGDPIEVQALTEVYRRHTARTGFCALGSVKANVGHLRSAAGAVGLIKACLALEHGTLPPALHFERPNPRIDFAATPFIVGTEARRWDSPGHPRRAAVSAFGFGGSNAHVVLEAPPARPESARTGRRHLLVVSARTDRAVGRRLRDLQAHLEDHPAVPRADVAHTLRAGRQAFAHRAALVVDDEAPAAPFGEDRLVSGVAGPGDRPVVFLFPGQGAQRPGTGRGLYAAEAIYRETVDHCAAILEPELGLDIRGLLHPVSAEAEAAARDALRQTRNAQPALFTVAYALARLVMSWGVAPGAMLGHSIGEYVAACLSGTFSLADALRLVALRGRLMQQCEPGAMLAVFLPEAELRPRLGELEVAAVNAPSVVVVSGPEAAIAGFAQELTAEGTGHRRLLTSHAFHSRMMEPALPEFRVAVARTRRQPPRIPFVSNVTGAFITAGEAVDPDYWARQLRQVVRFSDGVATLAGLGEPLFLELGPGRSLTGLLGQHGKAASAMAALAGHRADAADDEAHAILETLGWLWCHGVPVDWSAFDAGRPARKVTLPTYPFQRQRHWLNPVRQVPAVTPADSSAEPAPAPGAELGLYRVGWRPQAITAPASPVNEGTWLVFEDACGLGEAVARHLATMGARVVRLRAGDAYQADGPDAMRVRPGSKADLEAVLAGPSVGRAAGPLRVLHLWAVTGAEGPHNSVEAFETTSLSGFHTLLALVQAASEAGLADVLRAVVVADALCALDGEAGPLHAEKAALMGPCRVIPQEVPGLSMRCLDVPVFGPGPVPGWLIDAIVDEACRDDAAPVAALRPPGRYVEELALLPKLPVGRLRLRDRGTVLITGGLGGLGLEVARDLFEAVGARIVLLSRWAPPPRESWPARAQEDDKIGQALRKVRALEARGADILIVAADAGDPDAVAGAIDRARRRFGPLHGVVHAAGVVMDAPALHKTREVADQVFAAKVRGAFILERLLAETPLDFFVHFSSIAAQLPGAGRVDYAAANAVLDALARRPGPACHGLRCAIGWDAWREVGMAARRAARTATRRVVGGADTIDATLRDMEGRTLVEVQGYTKRELGERGPGTTSGAARAPFRLRLARPGDLASLALEPASLDPPRPGEVQIEVVAAGLNFRDVLSAMGQLPGADDGVGELGSECSGLVSVVGEGVEGVHVGDAVVAVASACFTTHVTTSADLVAPLPAGLAFTEAAGVPIAFLTADYGLNHLARLERGERVLIHSASGGVGLAAVQLARAIGAVIFATAGSPDKREYLRRLGIEHVMDSRSLDFADEVRERTDGEGVDVVLNALAGDYIGRSLELLRPFGRFVEIGKRDIYADTPLGLSPFRRNLAYFAVDLGVMRARRRPLLAKLLGGLLDRFARHELEPLPTTAVPIEEALRGFEHLARARHIGKVVLTLRDGGPPARPRPRTLEERFREVYGEGIAVARGLETLRHLLSSDETPPYLLVTPRRIAAGSIAPRPSDRGSTRGRHALVTAYAAPTAPDEESLVRLWQHMLGVDPVGIDDDFLALGGNSITAIQILYGVWREFGVQLPPTAVFDNPTVTRLAALIRGELRGRAAGNGDVDVLAKKMAALDEGTASRLLEDVRGRG
jgi:acyl transferase domain-containing protein/NADPH:quinone reductase-like Zn-dependent oxidoreductase